MSSGPGKIVFGAEFTNEDGSLKLPKVNKHWERKNPVMYDSNFGFGVNSYQPQVDRLNVSETLNIKRNSLPHLPNMDERCLPQHDSQKLHKPYTAKQIDHFAEKFEENKEATRQFAIDYSSAAHHTQHAAQALNFETKVETYRRERNDEIQKRLEATSRFEEEQQRREIEEEEELLELQHAMAVTEQMKKNVEAQVKAEAGEGEEDFKQYLRHKTFFADHQRDEHVAAMEERRQRFEREEREIDGTMKVRGLRDCNFLEQKPDLVPATKTDDDAPPSASYANTLTIERLLEPDEAHKLEQLEEK